MLGIDESKTILVYCDGSCSNIVGKNGGGWACVLVYGSKKKEISGGEAGSTSQRMELIACIKGLEAIKSTEIPIEVRSDSAYLVNCFNQKWYEKWIRKGWWNAKGEAVKNQDLWIKLISLVGRLPVTFRHVPSHSGIIYNERADVLARQARVFG